MSQEEIEALMNGLDDAPSETQPAPAEPEPQEPEVASVDEVVGVEAESVQEVSENIASQEEMPSEETPSIDTSDIDAMLASIDGVTDSEVDSSLGVESYVTEATTKSEPVVTPEPNESQNIESWTSEQVESGTFPLPADKDHKVVNQLNEVANDSEEKASKIFDVLSFVLDENNEIQTHLKKVDEFLVSEIEMLTSLSNKFPNVELFKSNLELAQSLSNNGSEMASKIDSENMKLFEAMELMQFHDINRQKIERVMAVIRKLSNYLNNLFEDDGSRKEVVVAKHIHGDNTADLVGDDDIDALISEFGK
jgi:flagellin-specific chaperone FliS